MIWAVVYFMMVVMMMMMLSFTFRLLRRRAAAALPLVRSLATARVRVAAAFSPRFRFSVRG